jgi:signal peptidase I
MNDLRLDIAIRLLLQMLEMFRLVLVKGQSMLPTLHNGERVLAWTPFSKRQFRRGTIVTLTDSHIHFSKSCQMQNDSDKTVTATKKRKSELFIKRLIGLPGDTVRVAVSQLAPHVLTTIDPQARQIDSEFVWQVPDNHVFVRGDGQNSNDSVTWGPIPMFQLQQIVLCHFPSLRRIR